MLGSKKIPSYSESTVTKALSKYRFTYILDAQTKKGLRLTSFADNLGAAVMDMQHWVDSIKATNEELWYADIFDADTQKLVGVVNLNEKNFCVASPAPADSKQRLFGRSRLIARLKGELR